jgi:predicted ATPase
MGMSQLLPVVVACLGPGEQMTCIEQPELHLHPRIQCALGDLVISASLGQTRTGYEFADGEGSPPESLLGLADDIGEGTVWREDFKQREVQIPSPRTIIIETHSEHLILRILRRIRETGEGQLYDGIAITPDDVSVCYVCQEDGQSVPRTLRIDDQGEFIDKWPKGFFEERAGELF